MRRRVLQEKLGKSAPFFAPPPEGDAKGALGSPLLERKNRPFTLTPAGEYFYQKSLILNDQRRAFSEEYVNLLLTTCESFVEVSARSPLAQLARITPQELKNIPCILVASSAQRLHLPWEMPSCGFRWCGEKRQFCEITVPSGRRTTPAATWKNFTSC